MAFTSWILNQAPASGGAALYNLKEMLKGAGWTVNGYSDGTTYLNNSAGVDGITTGSSGAGGFNNGSAWIRLTAPGGYEIVLQRGSGDEKNVYIKYSPSVGFSTGGNASTTPTSTDQVNVYSSSNSGSQLFGTGSTYYMQGGADDANGNGFWVACYNFSQQVHTAIVMEPLTQTDSNDVTAGYQNIFYVAYSISPSVFSIGDYFYGMSTTYVSTIKSYMDNSWVTIIANYYCDADASAKSFPSYSGSNPFSLNDDRVPIVYTRPTVDYNGTLQPLPHGYKGVSRFMTWEGVLRSCADTKSSKTRIVFGEVSLPWDGTTTPTV